MVLGLFNATVPTAQIIQHQVRWLANR